MGQPFIFILFKHQFYRKTVVCSRIWTQIVGVEDKHTDHLTTTTAPQNNYFIFSCNNYTLPTLQKKKMSSRSTSFELESSEKKVHNGPRDTRDQS